MSVDKNLLQRAWDSLAAWKEVYPENWQENDERLMDDLLTRIAELQGETALERLNKAAEDNGEPL